MNDASIKPFRTAAELQAELDWAAQALIGESSSSRIRFALPTLNADQLRESGYNWDVEVSCRPEQDETVRAAVQYVADKWQLATTGSGPSSELTAARRDRTRDVARKSAGDNWVGSGKTS